MSPTSKAQQRAVHKYVREKYDRLNITVPKGRKAVIQALAGMQGESLNGFVVKAIDERIGRLTGTPGDTEYYAAMLDELDKAGCFSDSPPRR